MRKVPFSDHRRWKKLRKLKQKVVGVGGVALLLSKGKGIAEKRVRQLPLC